MLLTLDNMNGKGIDMELLFFFSIVLNIALGIGFYINLGTIDEQHCLIQDMMRQLGIK